MMFKQKQTLVLSLLFALGFNTPNALATIIFDNGMTLKDHAEPSDVGVPQYTAENFTLSATSTINTVAWRGFYIGGDNVPGATDTFTLELYTNNAGVPATTPFSTFNVGNVVNRVDTGLTAGAAHVYSYSAIINSSALTAGQMYWLAVFNDTPSDSDNWHWLGAGNGGDGIGVRNNPGNAFSFTAVRKLNFTLDGSPAGVPEPAALSFYALGIAGLLYQRRKTRA